jgi:molybdopterin-guanine dinucleotide biosynthesis protein A
MSVLAAVVLAGGQSSRMGEDKSFLILPSSHESLLVHAQNTLKQVCGDNVFVSGSQHKNAIADLIDDCGPLSGVHAALQFFKAKHPSIREVLFMPVDMPNMRVEDLQALVRNGRSHNTLCSFENSFIPLYVPITKAIITYLDQQLAPQASAEQKVIQKKPQYSIKKMLDELQGIQIPTTKSTNLNNINTPQQWQSFVDKP